MNIFLRGSSRRIKIIWSALFVVLDGFFFLVLLPEVTARIKLFADLAVNWAYFGLTWFIGCALATLILAAVWLAAMILGKMLRLFSYEKAVSRAVFYGAFTGSMLLTFVVVLLGCGYYNIVYDKIVLKNWQGDKSIRIAFVSDTHLGFDDNVQKLSVVCDELISTKCDIALFGGDFVDDMTMLPQAISELRRLAEKLPQGVLFVNGNGDCTDGNWRDTKQKLLANNIIVLSNKVVNIADIQHPLLVVGVEYASLNNGNAFNPELQKKYLATAVAGLKNSDPKILLAHTPDLIESALPYHFDIMLFGHTHGGQVDLGFYRFMSREYQYISGKYEKGDSTIFVSNGIGQWFPARVNVPQQIYIIDVYPGK
ncbi:MAG: metallophosphoesterase [Bacillota bacterium]